MQRRFTVLTLLSLALGGLINAADRAGTVTILTQNMDAGTDQTYIVAAALNLIPGFTLADAVDLTAQELQASFIEQRAGVLAAKIAEKQPDLVSLQEVARWQIDVSSPIVASIVYDQLEFLLTALGAQGVPYEVVALNNVDDVTLPGKQVGAVRFTDRDVLLVRSGLGPPDLHFSDVHTHIFDAVFNFAGLPITAGWISADVHMGNRHFFLVTTHLGSPIPGVPEATDIQVAQAQELIHELRNTQIPVVICGDFNSDANGGHFVDDTPTAGIIQVAGYPEVWPLTHGSSDPGLTWPYYVEDLFPPPPFVVPSAPFERIDLFFERGMQVISSDLMIAPTNAIPPDASDHAGVIAVFRP
jgi:endonuclease/exonuclease/phosphatase family metal-dependent hydrolase